MTRQITQVPLTDDLPHSPVAIWVSCHAETGVFLPILPPTPIEMATHPVPPCEATLVELGRTVVKHAPMPANRRGNIQAFTYLMNPTACPTSTIIHFGL